jgi:enamine deaminase RidA (YjgF/YER057c/UK114 family)
MNNDKRKVLVNPKGSEEVYNSMKYSQAVRSGDTLWVSGQVGMDDKWKAGQGIEAQSRLAFQNLQKVISEAGGSLEDVVELVTFHTSMADMKVFSKVKSEFFPENYPAWTAVGVTELALPSLLIEVRATAVIGSGAGKKA